jgi:3-hydroxyisobutyrate dehydrogenase-like beta-hydroxyacid dehydrogenase
MALTIAASIAEAFAVAAKAGVKLEQLFEVASQSAYNTQIFQMLAGSALRGDLDGFKFSIRNAAKDLRYYTHLAESLPVASYIGEAVHQSYNQAVAMGLGDRLLGAMIEAQEKTNAMAILPKRN